MSYRNDIFISYRSNPETVIWLEQHFIPLLKLRVGLELGKEPIIFTDRGVENGATWPVELGRELARSRIMISLWSANYLHSRWCSLELAHMVARERSKKLRTPKNPYGIVLFVVVHDGDTIPQNLTIVQKIEIKRCFNVRMARDSPRAEELDAVLTENAPGIATAIREAPAFEASWPDKGARSFFNLFHQKSSPSQEAIPKFTS